MIFNQKPGVANADGVTPTTGGGPITYSGGSVDGQPAGGATSVAPRGPQGGDQGAFPDVRGAQYASPGAAGVTRYGLFANARGPGLTSPGGRRPTIPPGFGPGQPPMQMPRGDPSAGLRPAGQRFQPPAQGRLTSPVQGAAIPRIQPPVMRQQGAGQMMTNTMGGTQSGGQGPLAKVNNDPRVLLNALRSGAGRQTMGGGNPQQPQAMQQTMQQPPPNQQNAGLQQQFNQQQQQQQAAASQQNVRKGKEPNPWGWTDPLWGLTPSGMVGAESPSEYYDRTGPGGTGEPSPNGALVGQVAGDVGTMAGEGFSSFVDAWNAANPGSNMSYEDFLNIPGFDPSSLMGDVGQNWTAAMDPAAWEQMAQNRLAAANEANMGALNRGERRLADRAGRTGFANTGGVTSQMYNDYAGRGVQAERDIFNDTLMNQMNALQGASGFALGQNAQDQARWALEAGMAGHAADQNFGANREDNPSGAAVLGDLLGALGGAAGGAANLAGQGAGGIMSLLAIPGVMSALAGL